MNNTPINQQIVLSGAGGQGLGTGGKILAEAAIFQGLNAVQSQTYGAQARGGASYAEVIISSGEIFYPLAERADLLLTLTQPAYQKYKSLLAPQGTVIYDLNYVQPEPDGKTYGFNMLKYMRERKNERSVTIFALGIMAAHWLPVKKEFILAAIESNFAGNVAAINKQYFLAGFDIAREFLAGLI
ncbi:MAG: 2-oxoacid:acceptor oxidoreductase family protein [Peptococcaceae bacterium]